MLGSMQGPCYVVGSAGSYSFRKMSAKHVILDKLCM